MQQKMIFAQNALTENKQTNKILILSLILSLSLTIILFKLFISCNICYLFYLLHLSMNLLLSLLKPTFYYLRIRSCLNIQVDMTDLGVIHKCISSEIAIFFRYFLNTLPPPP